MKNDISRRKFLTLSALGTTGLFLNTPSVFGNKITDWWLIKPNSKFGGVQMGAITYSFRSMPHDIDQLLKFCIDANVGAIEMMGDPAETYAGKPKNPIQMGPPPKNGQRPAFTDEQKTQMADYNKKVAEWRATASMDKFKEIRKKFNTAGVTIYAFKPNAFGANNSDVEISFFIVENLLKS